MREELLKRFKRTEKPRQLHALYPWRWQRQGDDVRIEAYVQGSLSWETVATIAGTSDGVNAEEVAKMVVDVVNRHHREREALEEAVRALEDVVDEGLNFATEQQAEHAIRELQKVRA